MRLKLIINALTHGLHYNLIKLMIDSESSNTTTVDSNNQYIIKRELFYNLTIDNDCKIQYKPFNYIGSFNELGNLVKKSILDDYDNLKSTNYTYFIFLDKKINRLKTSKLNIELLPNIENINCDLNDNDIICFIFNFINKIKKYEAFYDKLEFDNYMDVYNTFIKDKMFLMADIINEVFSLNQPNDIYLKNKNEDQTYSKLIKYSRYLIEL